MSKKNSIKKSQLDTINTIFSSMNGANHVLHLYTPNIDKYLIHASFLSNGEEESAYVTNDDPKKAAKKFNSFKIKPVIFHTEDINKVLNFKKIVIDGDSISLEQAQECINSLQQKKDNMKNCSILSTYDVSKLNPNEIKNLVEHHDKLIMTTDSRTVVSSKSSSFKNLNIDNKLIDEFVKKELRTIVLALITKEPMCGREIQMEIYKKFNILLSAGTLYPLLHSLEKTGLAKCTATIKTKVYSVIKEKEVRKILNEHIQIKNFLNNFLQSTMIKEI